jgi:hypothetical protein
MNKFFQDIRETVEKFNDQLLNTNKSNRSGGGTRLGGGSGSGSSSPDLRTVTLDQPGSIGCRVEKNEVNSMGACIISHVEPNSVASHAGLQRGDIICNAYCIEKGGEHNDTKTANGSISSTSSSSGVLSYDAFLSLVKSNRRPLVLQIRRIGISAVDVGSRTATAAAAASSSSSSTPSMSANAEVRRKAVMAAAEARERAHQQKMKPIEKGTRKASTASTTTTTTRAVEINNTPVETKRAIEAAKAGEAGTIAQLGYNPYEVIKGTGHQAQMAIIATGTSTTNPLATTTTDTTSTQLTHHNTTIMSTPLNEPFDHAFLLLITSTTNHTEKEIVSSLSIMRKLILNATTKGLQEEDSDKYRRVRLSNPKIQSAIVAMQGGLDLMFSCGFELVEENTETYLVYPIDKEIPHWIPMALQRMNDYVEQQRE